LPPYELLRCLEAQCRNSKPDKFILSVFDQSKLKNARCGDFPTFPQTFIQSGLERFYLPQKLKFFFNINGDWKMFSFWWSEDNWQQ
jgi:hypothetical protein